MKIFTISQLEQFSGVKAHTIRIWEQRYNALQPSRSDGNTRYYDNNQLRRLLNIVSLMDYKYKPSKLGTMSDDDLFQLIEKHLVTGQTNDSHSEFFISQLLAAGTEYNEELFHTIYENALKEKGLKKVYEDIIYPLLVRVGYMWTQDSLIATQEHFISNLIKQKIFSEIEQISKKDVVSDKSWLLFLPENEFHELGLLIANYLLKSSGNKVCYLGSNVPLEALRNTLDEVYFSDALTFVVHTTLGSEVSGYQKLMKEKNIKLYIGASEFTKRQLETEVECTWLSNLSELEQHV
jgi:MerR family transcriptional regulator, light-induced transcriptional regulator